MGRIPLVSCICMTIIISCCVCVCVCGYEESLFRLDALQSKTTISLLKTGENTLRALQRSGLCFKLPFGAIRCTHAATANLLFCNLILTYSSVCFYKTTSSVECAKRYSFNVCNSYTSFHVDYKSYFSLAITQVYFNVNTATAHACIPNPNSKVADKYVHRLFEIRIL